MGRRHDRQRRTHGRAGVGRCDLPWKAKRCWSGCFAGGGGPPSSCLQTYVSTVVPSGASCWFSTPPPPADGVGAHSRCCERRTRGQEGTAAKERRCGRILRVTAHPRRVPVARARVGRGRVTDLLILLLLLVLLYVTCCPRPSHMGEREQWLGKAASHVQAKREQRACNCSTEHERLVLMLVVPLHRADVREQFVQHVVV